MEISQRILTEFEDCYYKYKNKGMSGADYALFRMTASSSSFWAQAANAWLFWLRLALPPKGKKLKKMTENYLKELALGAISNN